LYADAHIPKLSCQQLQLFILSLSYPKDTEHSTYTDNNT